ncbi:unnamed protein product [Alternaria alternata]
MMSTSMKHKSIPATFNEKEPAATAKSPRPTSAPYPNFSKPLAKETAATTEPKLVAAEELQARIKAARRSRTATQPLPEAVRRKLDHSTDVTSLSARCELSSTTPPDREQKVFHDDETKSLVKCFVSGRLCRDFLPHIQTYFSFFSHIQVRRVQRRR